MLYLDGTVSRLQSGQSRNWGLTLGKGNRFVSFPQCPDWFWHPYNPWRLEGLFTRIQVAGTYLHLVLRLRMCEAILSILCTSSCGD
jgi:hypothetical protein